MAISLSKILFAYPQNPEKLILDVPFWQIKKKEKVLVTGPSGHGKSTLLNLISGMLNSTKGELSVMGNRLDLMNSRQRDRFRAKHIGYVFQQFNLIPYLNALENIRLATHFSKVERTSSLHHEMSDLLLVLNVPPSDWQKPTAQLSIGQQQRVAIARAIINKPDLLIADEPTSSLDKENRDNFMSVLMPLVQQHDMTLLFVSHDQELSTYFDRVEELSNINSGKES